MADIKIISDGKYYTLDQVNLIVDLEGQGLAIDSNEAHHPKYEAAILLAEGYLFLLGELVLYVHSNPEVLQLFLDYVQSLFDLAPKSQVEFRIEIDHESEQDTEKQRIAFKGNKESFKDLLDYLNIEE